ncbi:MAG TPA: two-component regulator propeller domain-containing protein [Vicinamibacterales bacterium]|nr:two-component regulator propeller domain-containing protein [Vicinamibacterales bacterium]
MRSWWALPVVLIVSGAAPAWGARLPLRTYTTADGLPHNEVNCLAPDPRGFLWLCTGDGLSRFDGVSFVTYGTAEGLPHPRVSRLLQTRDGRYFVATDGGLARFDPAGDPARRTLFVPVGIRSGPQGMRATALFEDRGGTIWCGTDHGLYRLDETVQPSVLDPVDLGMPREYAEQRVVSALAQGAGGSLWIATPDGLYRRWPDGRHARYTVADGLPGDYLHDLLVDHDGHLWAASRYAGIFRFAADDSTRPPVVVERYSIDDGLAAAWVFGLFETSNHRFWIATNRGLAEMTWDGHARRFRTLGVAQGLSSSEITALGEDASGNLWMGTNTAGLMKMARTRLLTYGPDDGLVGVNALFEDEAGNLCARGTVPPERVGTAGAPPPPYTQTAVTRFGCLEGTRFVSFTPAALDDRYRVGWVQENVTLRTRRGEWWLGTGTGVYRFPASRRFRALAHARPIARYTVRDGLAAAQVFGLYEDAREGVWVATVSRERIGLARWDRSSVTWTRYDTVPDLMPLLRSLPRAFAEDRTGAVWIGFDAGLARVRGDRVHVFTAADGWSQQPVRDMHVDRRGRLWLASSAGGLFRVDAPEADRPAFIAYTKAQGLSSNSVAVVAEDLYGRIYAGTSRGLDRLNPETGRIEQFTTSDGLAPGLFRAALRDRAGVLWFGLTGGLTRFEPVPEGPAPTPRILLTNVSLNGARVAMSLLGVHALALPQLQPGRNQLVISFGSVDFSPGERLKYQYMLEGAAGTWSPATTTRSVDFANLAAGAYRFVVRTVGSDGRVSTEPASLAFVILPPVWRRWWFVLLAGLALAALAASVHRLRMRRILDLANLRARIATDLHDDIGANLTTISILSEVARQQPRTATAEAPLATIARIARDSVAAMSDIVWAVNPSHDRLTDLVRRMRLQAEELFAGRDVALSFRAPEDTDPALGADVRRDLFLVFKEAVHNAARHARCRRVQVTLTRRRRTLSLEIRDDGIGFEEPRAEGEGLTTMRTRAQRLGGTCDVLSRPGQGTIVRVRVPITRTYRNR